MRLFLPSVVLCGVLFLSEGTTAAALQSPNIDHARPVSQDAKSVSDLASLRVDQILAQAQALRGYTKKDPKQLRQVSVLLGGVPTDPKVVALRSFFGERSIKNAQAILNVADSPLSKAVAYMCLAEAYYAKGDSTKAIMYSVLSLAYDFSSSREEQAKFYLTGSKNSDISLNGSKDEVIERLNAVAKSTWNPGQFRRFFTMASTIGLLPEFPYLPERLTKPLSEPIHMCVAFDDNYVYHGGVALLSAVLSADPSSQYVFHIAEDPDSTSLITPKHRKALQNMLRRVDPERFRIAFDKFDLDVMPDYVLHTNTKRWPRTMLFRPYYAYFYHDLDRILSLDGDMIVRADLTDLYNTNLGDDWVLGSRDLAAEVNLKNLGLDTSIPYLNGGLVLFDGVAIRKNNLKAIYDAMLAPDSEFIEKMRFNEQDIYPIAYEGHIREIDVQDTPESRWNWFYWIDETTAWQNINLTDYAIIHLAGRSRKPWNRKSSPFLWTLYPWKNDGVQNLYWALRNMGPWPNE